MDAYYVLICLIWLGAAVGLAFIPANIAKKKGYSYGGFWALGFFFFLIGLIVALCLDPRPGSEAYREKYPYPPYAGAAPWQGAYYGQTGPYPPPYTPPQQQNAGEVRCAQCANGNPPGSLYCSKCGSRLA